VLSCVCERVCECALRAVCANPKSLLRGEQRVRTKINIMVASAHLQYFIVTISSVACRIDTGCSCGCCLSRYALNRTSQA
jgi:hypothetical protein